MPELFTPAARPRTIRKQGAASRRSLAPQRDVAENNVAKPIPAPSLEGEIVQLPFVARMVAEVLFLRDPQEAQRYVRHIIRIGS